MTIMIAKKQILILINKKTSEKDKNWNFFRNAVSESIGPDTNITMGELESLTFVLSKKDSKVYDRVRGFSLDDFDLVVFRFVRRDFALAASCASFLRSKNIPYVDSHVKPGFWSKYSAQALRLGVGFANIPSVTSSTQELKYMVENDIMPIAYPLIIKDNNGKKGRLNFIAYDKETALSIFDENPEVNFIVQEFIKNDGDYRFLVMGDKISTIIHRKAQSNSHLNNTSQGASSEIAKLSDFSEEMLSDVIRAAQLEGLEIAGVDLMIDKNTGQHYILEVNSSPQLATGAVPEVKLKAYTDYLKSLL